MALRATRQIAEALVSGDGKLRATRQYIEVLVPVEPERTCDNVLELEDSTTILVHYNSWYPTNDILNVQQSIRLAGYEWAENILLLSQVALGHGAIEKIIHHGLNLTDTARSRNYYINVEDTLELEQLVPRFIEVDVNHTLNLLSFFSRVDHIVHTLVINQSIVHGKSAGFPTQYLDLEQSINISGIWIRTIEDTVLLNQSLTCFYDTGCVRKSYSPFIGETTITLVEPPLAELPFIQTSTRELRLDYPALGAATDYIILRPPELDNTDQVSANRINRETSGGELIIYADPIWPRINSIKVLFMGLCGTLAQDLQNFIIAHLGKDILLTDWEGREWVGIITTPDDVITHDGENNWSASFTFEGELLDSCTPDTGLSISDAVSARGDWHRKPVNYLNVEDEILFNCDWDRNGSDFIGLSDEVEATVVSP